MPLGLGGSNAAIAGCMSQLVLPSLLASVNGAEVVLKQQVRELQLMPGPSGWYTNHVWGSTADEMYGCCAICRPLVTGLMAVSSAGSWDATGFRAASWQCWMWAVLNGI